MAEYEGEHSSHKSERRQAKQDKAKDRMDQGKKVKLMHRMELQRAVDAGAQIPGFKPRKKERQK